MKQFLISDEEIKQMYLGGYSLSQIAKVAQNTRGLMSLRKKLQSMGVDTSLNMKRYSKRFSDIKRRYALDEHVFDSIDSDEKAYWLGFLYADGYNREDRNVISITLQKSDILHLVKFQTFLSTNIPVREYTTKGYTKCVINVSSLQISNQLAKLGCTQAKTFTRKYPSIENKFNSSFIRGYFDGNGCFSHTTTTEDRWQLSFTGNKDLILPIQNILEEEIGLNHISLNTRSDKSSVAIHYSGRNVCRKILTYMYDTATVYLDRKYDKYCELYLGVVTRNNNKPCEFMGTPNSFTEDNHEPSLYIKEGATTISKESTSKRMEVQGPIYLGDDIV